MSALHNSSSSVGFSTRINNGIQQATNTMRTIFAELLDLLNRTPIINSFINAIETGYRHVRAWLGPAHQQVPNVGIDSMLEDAGVTHAAGIAPMLGDAGVTHAAGIAPMLGDRAIFRGIQKWARALSGEEAWLAMRNHASSPKTLDTTSPWLERHFIQDIEGNNIHLPYCIPLHVGKDNGGHWVTLVLHDDMGERRATLFNSITGGRNAVIKEFLDPILARTGVQPLQCVEFDLQQNLQYGCGVFTVAAIEKIMLNYIDGNPKTVNEILLEFGNECQARDIADQHAWDQQWRASLEEA